MSRNVRGEIKNLVIETRWLGKNVCVRCDACNLISHSFGSMKYFRENSSLENFIKAGMGHNFTATERINENYDVRDLNWSDFSL